MNKDRKNIEAYVNNNPMGENQFSVPDDYFNAIEDNVLSKIIEEQLPGKFTYNVPDNYFENFEERLFSNAEFSKTPTKVISLKSRILKYIPTAAAASILLFIGLNIFTAKDPFNTISTDDLDSWFDENYIDYSTVNTIDFVDTDFTERNILEDDISLEDEDILEYLNTIDTSNLLTEIES